jgi:O-methyltransferase involved in polyketide biosynthesis
MPGVCARAPGGTVSKNAEPGPETTPRIDTSRPNIARVHDYLTGGKDNYAADRAEAARLLAIAPHLARLARENREFLTQAVAWAATRGVRQFLDLGPGMPAATNTHQVAQGVAPGTRVVYVDRDPVVVLHASALLAGNGITEAIRADVTSPKSILDHPVVRAMIDPGEPAGIVAGMVLQFLPADQAERVMAELVDMVAPGSWFIVSVGYGAPGVGDRLAASYQAGTLYNHPLEVIEGFLGGLELMPPGLVDAADWVPGTAAAPLVLTGMHVLAAAGRKPDR